MGNVRKKKGKKSASLSPSCFTLLGFYMKMREVYTTPGKSIYYMTVEWPASALAWEGTVLQSDRMRFAGIIHHFFLTALPCARRLPLQDSRCHRP